MKDFRYTGKPAPTKKPPAAAKAVKRPSLDDLIDNAITSGNFEAADRLMARRDAETADARRLAFNNAIANAKAAFGPIVKNRSTDRYKYADFAAIADAIDEPLRQCLLNYRFRTKQDEHGIHVTCVLTHALGHSEETTLSGPADSSGGKNGVQAIGSTLTYLQRYSIMQALGLAAAADDDGRGGGPAKGTETITAAQAKTLRDLIAQTQTEEPKFLKLAGCDTIEGMLASKYGNAHGFLQQKLANMQAAKGEQK